MPFVIKSLLQVLLALSLLSPLTFAAPPQLTATEQQWLQQHPVVRMGIDPGYGPYSFIDRDGTVRGVAVDFLQLLSEQLGIRFVLTSDLDWSGLMTAVRERKLDAVATVVLLPERKKFLAFTEIYLPTPLVILTRDTTPQLKFLQQLERMKLALVKGYSSSKQLLQRYPELKPLFVKKPLEGLQAVALGKADAYVGVLGVNSFLAHRNGISGLKINAAFDMTDNGQTIAVRKDWAPLAHILDKGLKAITTEQRDAIFNRWLPLQAGQIARLNNPSLATRLFPWLLGLLVIALVGYLLVLFWNRQLQQSLRKRLSELAQQHQEIDRLNGLLNAMVAASSDAIYVKNTAGIYQFCNKALTEFLDKPLDQIIGKDDYALFSRQLAEQFHADDQKIMALEKPITYEELAIRPNGETLPYLIIKGPLRINNQLVGLFGIARDISELKQTQRQLEHACDELEQRVKDRTRQLEQTNKELETFSYTVSHDLKAPLRGIDGYSRLLLEDHADQLNEEGQLFLSRLLAGAEQMSQLIDDLLAYSRLERQSLRPQKIVLASVLERVQNEFSEELKTVHLQAAMTSIELHVDADALTLILRNLLDNAIKFSRTSHLPTITIDATLSEHKLLLSIRDNGIGFDMQFHDRIFEIFQRLQRAEDYPGTGVGLAISMKATHRLGGQLYAESTPGEGAIFYLELPQ
ncbi:MAG TPA: transporter substrate-binding domain-containing protein [Gammaproteobacteria bacterium]|nr:transporter substrate-binding domain-containing protein [Gammaproteobacteria bacterium]